MAPSKKKSAGTPPPQTISPQNVEFINGPHYAAFYCNNVSFAVNVLDFVMIFGETLEATADKAVVEQRARVTMHPTQAKVTAMLLLRNIQNYEALNGPIPIPGALGREPSGG